VTLQPVPVEKGVLVIHVSSGALKKYPREPFVDGAKFTCRVGGSFKQPEENRTIQFAGAILLIALDTFDGMNGLLQAYPALKAKEDLEAMAFTNEQGTSIRREEQGTFTLGPITKGWTAQDKRDAIDLMATIMSRFDCFVATVVYPNPMAHEVEVLRRFRDEVLLETKAGAHLARLYYIHGPRWATAVLRDPELVPVIRGALDQVVAFIEHANLEDPAVEWKLNAAIACADRVASLFLQERKSSIDAFRRELIYYLAPQKMTLRRPQERPMTGEATCQEEGP